MGFFKNMLMNNRRTSGKKRNNSNSTSQQGQRSRSPHEAHHADAAAFYTALSENERFVRQKLSGTEDIVSRSISLGNRDGLLIYMDTACDSDKIHEDILKPITRAQSDDLMRVLTATSVIQPSDLEEAIDLMLLGHSLVFIEGAADCHAVLVNSFNNRSVNEPLNEKAVQGAHNGFIESLPVNLNLIRSQIHHRGLVVRHYTLGNLTKTRASIVYLKDLADPLLVEEIDSKLKAIDADNLMSGYLVLEYIEKQSYSPFPQILQTERPDRAVGNLLEGRVALLMDNTPAALIMPVTFFTFYQSPDDYNSRSIAGSFIRLLRLFSFMIAIMLPAFYIAVLSFHYEVIPNEVFYQIKGSIDKIPYPPILEAFFMELTIELLREAGIRLPGPLGQSIGIVGGLVIGDAVVRVGLVSYPMIIVVALTAIASFVIPSHEMSYSVRLLRFPMMIAASLLGFFGIVFSLTVILIHLCKLESFGTPYFAPMSPMRILDWKDAFVRLPFWKLNERPLAARPQKLVQEKKAKGGRQE
ncbi:spore germination protein [Cohnella soli]|uniref:Spore germination protein n=1 Tax=Cohnella soli TaxID=425005 RepID=A0ABW0HR18_9BACL